MVGHANAGDECSDLKLETGCDGCVTLAAAVTRGCERNGCLTAALNVNRGIRV